MVFPWFEATEFSPDENRRRNAKKKRQARHQPRRGQFLAHQRLGAATVCKVGELITQPNIGLIVLAI